MRCVARSEMLRDDKQKAPGERKNLSVKIEEDRDQPDISVKSYSITGKGSCKK